MPYGRSLSAARQCELPPSPVKEPHVCAALASRVVLVVPLDLRGTGRWNTTLVQQSAASEFRNRRRVTLLGALYEIGCCY